MTTTPATTVDVTLEGVVKRFDDAVAVNGISLEVPHGSFFALLGPSGCGKTTTLRMIGGFEEPTGGRILLGDEDVVGLPPYKRDVNTVFQSYALFPHMTVTENVAFGLERRGVKKEEAKGRVQEILALVGLETFGNRKPKQLWVGSSNASRSPARSSITRGFSCSTSRSARSISSSASRCSSSLSVFRTRSGSRSSTSRMTRRRR